MSIIVKIREKFSWILVSLIALSLIAFILEDGLSTGSSIFGDSDELGEIDGVEITKEDFETDIETIEKANPQAKREEIIPYVWQHNVTRILMEEYAHKAGILVTPKEIDDIIYGNESPFLREFTDQKTGEFKVNDLRASLAQLKKSKDESQRLQVEKIYLEPSIEQRLAIKYQAALQQGIYVPTWYAEKMRTDNSSVSSVQYLFERYENLDSLAKVKVSNDDIEAYLSEHANLYQNQEKGRDIKYVQFPITPSSTDSMLAKQKIYELKLQLKKTSTAEDVQRLANLNDVKLIYDKNSYNPIDKIKPTIKDSITKYSAGDVIGPFIDGGSYELDKIVSIKKRPDSASVRHILIMTEDPQNKRVIRTDDEAKRIADSIELAIKNGADFNTLCAKYSEDPGSNTRGGFYNYFGQGYMVPPFNDFAFDNSVGKKGVVKTVFGYHYIEVLNQKNFATMYNVAYFSLNIEPSTETINEANNAAASFASQCRTGQDLDSISRRQGLAIQYARAIKQNDFSIQNIQGAARNVVRWIFDHPINQISEPLEIGNNLYIMTVTNEVTKGLMTVAEAKAINVDKLVKNHKIAVYLRENKWKGQDLNQVAKSLNKPVQRLDSVGFENPFIIDLGAYEPKFVGAAFNKNFINKSSPLEEGNGGVFMVIVNDIKTKPSLEDIKIIQQNTKGRLKNGMNNFLQKLMENADINDNRNLYY